MRMPIAFLPRAALVCAVLLCMLTDARSETVPDLFDMTVAEAERHLSGLGLTSIAEHEDSALRRGIIFRQIPGKGGSLGEGDLVIYWVSNGLVIPYGLIGQPPKTLHAELEGMGATVQITTRDVVNSIENGVHEDNRVLEIVGMKAGDRFDATIDVLTLVVSNVVGIEVPNLAGASQRQIQDLLQPLGLVLDYEFITDPPSNSHRDSCLRFGTVYRHRGVTPKEGETVQRGTVIQVRDTEFFIEDELTNNNRIFEPTKDIRC